MAHHGKTVIKPDGQFYFIKGSWWFGIFLILTRVTLMLMSVTNYFKRDQLIFLVCILFMFIIFPAIICQWFMFRLKYSTFHDTFFIIGLLRKSYQYTNVVSITKSVLAPKVFAHLFVITIQCNNTSKWFYVMPETNLDELRERIEGANG
ncbi:MAG: hypothetical protein C4541_09350 [Candidatus Auribacter fodinae]|jgi:type II secretory pathway component PulF|uniref:Uncharacterized protein n=1 Tax=Candidatus Auribacter fodinae TaxID=2093366 RepID=A0A3A4QVY3_9BACT|nr:MAG: hypothetical protein C4541_09350 [Candidatus Auribacter fodinae]